MSFRMGRQHLRNGATRVIQQKTGWAGEIPIPPELARVLDAVPAGNLTFLVTEAGAPFTAAGFGNAFRDWCNEAGLPKERSSHGLRKAACRRLAQGRLPSARRGWMHRARDSGDQRPPQPERGSAAHQGCRPGPAGADGKAQNRNPNWRTRNPVLQNRPVTHCFLTIGGEKW